MKICIITEKRLLPSGITHKLELLGIECRFMKPWYPDIIKYLETTCPDLVMIGRIDLELVLPTLVMFDTVRPAIPLIPFNEDSPQSCDNTLQRIEGILNSGREVYQRQSPLKCIPLRVLLVSEKPRLARNLEGKFNAWHQWYHYHPNDQSPEWSFLQALPNLIVIGSVRKKLKAKLYEFYMRSFPDTALIWIPNESLPLAEYVIDLYLSLYEEQLIG